MQATPLETITLAGGCFWCTEAVFARVRGVVDVQSGYANGHVSAPTYEQVCTGSTGHAEAVRVRFDPAQISLRELLEIFFATHDPTTLNRQEHDVGPQYRSGIYTTHPEHEAVARALLHELQEGGHWGAPIVTELQALTAWWPAEDYHTDYFAQHSHQGYCAAVIAPKVEKFRATFARLLKSD
ncbi:MAG: peptide-methionine (S)-S-oxide reductase [Burkholderiales bacterium 68-12]|nr:MAG: peptide-methionine (S)-S-oxide reductase [Burkholderiales bacterium 68-12]